MYYFSVIKLLLFRKYLNLHLLSYECLLKKKFPLSLPSPQFKISSIIHKTGKPFFLNCFVDISWLTIKKNICTWNSGLTWHWLHVLPVSSCLQGHWPVILSHTLELLTVPVKLQWHSKIKSSRNIQSKYYWQYYTQITSDISFSACLKHDSALLKHR